MSGTVPPPEAATITDPGIKSAMTDMQAAFAQAIETNAEITVLKTRLGSEETAAQQRPNIG